ncbi:hypothetical protein [Ruegeria arenilitoris]|uniref:hypothetical protein n=1 Tax=Ruegeria arenilitoris TaxID=1173585 RepID=UPI001C2BC3B1|nr:hypothetical protein [Ruegeria arenilitoris]
MNLSTLQPIVNVELDDGWSIGTSEMTSVYDWQSSEFVALPVGIKLSKLLAPK